jgi:hypothetical protein
VTQSEKPEEAIKKGFYHLIPAPTLVKNMFYYLCLKRRTHPENEW